MFKSLFFLVILFSASISRNFLLIRLNGNGSVVNGEGIYKCLLIASHLVGSYQRKPSTSLMAKMSQAASMQQACNKQAAGKQQAAILS